MVYFKKNTDMTGQRIGKVEILFKGLANNYYCKCDCGKQYYARERTLRSGSHRRCSDCAQEARRTYKQFARVQ